MATKEQIELQKQLIRLAEQYETVLQRIQSGEIKGRVEIEDAYQRFSKLKRKAQDDSETDYTKFLKENPKLRDSFSELSKEQEKATATTGDLGRGMKGLMAQFGPAGLGMVLGGSALGLTKLTGVLKKVSEGFDGLSKPILMSREAITNEFGGAIDAQGKIISQFAIDAATSQENLMNELAKTPRGLAAADPYMRSFSQNFAKAQKELVQRTAKMRQAVGTEMEYLQDAFRSDASVKEIDHLRLALGMTEEDLASVAAQAQIGGTTLVRQMAVSAQATDKMSERYGVNFGLVRKATNALRKDFGTFGTFSEQQLAKVAAQAVKLGVSLDGIKKMTIHDSFDTAAEKAAMLGQSFGINIDAFDLFMEEDPAERLRMIQEAAQQAGVDVANMSRVEMKHLADLTGMDVKDTMKALSDSGQNLQSQLGVAEEGKVAAEDRFAQNNRMIEVQASLADIMGKVGANIATVGSDTASDIAGGQLELLAAQGNTFQKMGNAQINAAAALTKASGKLITLNPLIQELLTKAGDVTARNLVGEGTKAITGGLAATDDILKKVQAQRLAGGGLRDEAFLKTLGDTKQQAFALQIIKVFDTIGNQAIQTAKKAADAMSAKKPLAGTAENPSHVTLPTPLPVKMEPGTIQPQVAARQTATANVPVTADGGKLKAGTPQVSSPIPIDLTVNLLASNDVLATATANGTPDGQASSVGTQLNNGNRAAKAVGVGA